MKTNDIKKGMRFQLRNGWYATMEDNMRGNTRVATVEGFYTEMGSVYAHDIVFVLTDNGWELVEHTDSQIDLRAEVDKMSRMSLDELNAYVGS